MTGIQLQFRLKFATRRDDEANVHVGYCPALKLYSQGRTDEEAGRAIVSATSLFIVACYERDILHSVLRERGMTKATSNIQAIAADEKREYISIGNFDREFEADVPISLLAAQQMGELCLQQ